MSDRAPLRRSACGAGSPACWSSIPLLRGPIPARPLLWKQQHRAGSERLEVLGALFLISRDIAVLSCKLIYLPPHWDWMVLYPVLPGYHKDYDFCFLWGCAKGDFVHLDLILSKLQHPMHLRLVFLLYKFFMLFHVFQWEATQGRGGWNGWPPTKPSCHSPKSYPAWKLSAQE